MVPKNLKRWFAIHFIADMVIGLPLLLAPRFLLGLFGWETESVFAFRIVGAALMGIGWESLLGRDEGQEHFRGMLRLKLIWSSCAVFGMSWGILGGEAPPIGWIFVAVFALFFAVWAYYARELRSA